MIKVLFIFTLFSILGCSFDNYEEMQLVKLEHYRLNQVIEAYPKNERLRLLGDNSIMFTDGTIRDVIAGGIYGGFKVGEFQTYPTTEFFIDTINGTYVIWGTDLVDPNGGLLKLNYK